MVSLLFFYKDGFSIKQSTEFNIPLKKETNPSQANKFTTMNTCKQRFVYTRLCYG